MEQQIEKPKTAWEQFLSDNGFKEEEAEVADGIYEKTGYPVPAKSFRLKVESFGTPIEAIYYWFLDHLKQDQGYSKVEKIIDTFSASETSAFWGQSSQRIGLQQDKAGGYLRVISELIKQLFQIVRELRMIDEKLVVRQAWKDKTTGEKLKSADVTLKSEFVELVEGGAKEVSSVYGLAREVGYHILPDLFFNTHVYSIRAIDDKVDGMDYNKRVKNVLKKKLFNFLNWKEQTDKEFNTRREFQLRYMYQHWQTIKTYMNWIKPYLRNIKRLSMNQKHIESADIIGAFETSMIEIEILAHKKIAGNVHACTLANFSYTTKPDMNFHTQDYQHKGPIHVGNVTVSLKAYGWSEQQIEAYKKYKDDEDLELLGLADDKIQSAMDMLGDSFKKYLEECGEIFGKDKEKLKPKPQQQESILSPFIAIFKGFAEIGGGFFPGKQKEDDKGPKLPNEKYVEKAEGVATLSTWLTYKIYKKANDMLTW